VAAASTMAVAATVTAGATDNNQLLDSLTAMVAYMRPLFKELCHCLITFKFLFAVNV
jgi:hypothetical protein